MPVEIIRLAETLSDGMPHRQARAFLLRFFEAFSTCGNHELACYRFGVALMDEQIARLERSRTPKEQAKRAIYACRCVRELHVNAIATSRFDADAASQAEKSAASIAETAFWPMAWFAAKSAEAAARSVSRSVVWRAEVAAVEATKAKPSSRIAAASETARSAVYISYADRLIEILRLHWPSPGFFRSVT